MPHFGATSRARFETCHGDLQVICNCVIRAIDFTIICGRRDEAAQNEAYRNGYSWVKWPDSRHNTPEGEFSRAVDIAPWHAVKPHIHWDHDLEFARLAGYMQMAAYNLGYSALVWGGDWDEDDDLYDANLPFDLGHFELPR